MIVVSDTSPLRALQALGRVALLERIYGEIMLPPTVVTELAVEAPVVGPFAVIDYPWLVVRRPVDRTMVARLEAEVNAGEAEALALALEVRAGSVLIDESAGRRVAARLGLRTTGVLALLVQAKALGMVERVGPLIDELHARIRFRVSETVRKRVLEDAGEG